MFTYPPLLLLVATVTVTVTATSYFHFDDLCGLRNSQQLDNPLSVVLTDAKEKLQDAATCVCFSPGVYEYHDSTDCDYHDDDDDDKDSTSTPLVLDSPGCFQLPHSARALRKQGSRSRQELSLAPAPITMTSVFPSCGGEPLRRRRVKRQEAPPEAAPAAAPAAGDAPAAAGAAAAPPGAPAPPNAMIKTVLNDSFDEDFSSTGTEIGHELMRGQMSQYIENVIAKLTGLSGDGGVGEANQGGNTRNHKYPVVRLLDYTKQIMQRTCSVISGDFLDLAMNAFVNLQMETYHIKEPYIGYSAYKRIEKAMHRCLASADPHVFLMAAKEDAGGGGDAGAGGNGTAAGGNGTQAGGRLPSEMCDNHVPHQTSNQTVLRSGTDAEEIKNIVIPEYASSILNAATPAIAEPLIETVWKMLVSTHSYCYIFFSDYFNDHHTYTVALLPLFTNAIQSIWLNDDGKGYELKEGNKLYGGLLGNVKKIMTDVDLCVGASRAISPYPWFMNRPLLDKSNAWRRKKRGILQGDDDDDHHQSLLFDDDEDQVDTVIGKAMTANGEPALSHVCTKNVPRERVCGVEKKKK